mmetsp:Transcript_14112/g.23454  ORF Transcript_14112/g.23454 Transcript_14112/m.23454 type:complete len:132 (-) Transcript_14112:201-596(-)|eukprot:CAMPEP_0119316974 /NCGR_PEP_ID=MMETSP1333-20130426/41531_1 /TAXON_ID=418940 /ORGANISM="Scyphosphaera apsteinii, Strain RCC1455" /LENGTH=131 /DNA_ID=CAMNT_0007322765 /DNA_START=39 /DNA_END=434 /DNA_ORIENTATION=+
MSAVLAVISAVAWSASNLPVVARRELIIAGLSSIAPLIPAPAIAQKSKLTPRNSKDATAAAKAYQLSKPSEESEAFQAAERMRQEKLAGTFKGESDLDLKNRLLSGPGVRTYADALAKGEDTCATSFGCRK